MNSTKTMLGVACALGALAGCATPQAVAHATTAAALSDATGAELAKPSVVLRVEDEDDAVQQAALASIRRTLEEQGFAFTGNAGENDADIVVRSERGSAKTSISLVARLGARVMVPVKVDVPGDGGVADDEAAADLAMRWQRRFRRSPRLDRHLEPDLASSPAFAPVARVGLEARR